MESFAFGAGVLLALLGPLLLIPVVWLVYRWVARPLVVMAFGQRVASDIRRWIGLGGSILLVAGVLVLSYLPGRLEFERLCAQHARPQVSRRINVESFYRTRLYPYEAQRFLEGKIFTFVEAPHLYKKGVYVRYSWSGAERKVVEEEVAELKSLYGVRETFSQLRYGIHMIAKVVYKLSSGQEVGKAAEVVYQGGPLWVFLGSYGMSSCPDIRSADGSQHFQTFYDLEFIVLRAPWERKKPTQKEPPE
jgi:hypothetical protein